MSPRRTTIETLALQQKTSLELYSTTWMSGWPCQGTACLVLQILGEPPSAQAPATSWFDSESIRYNALCTLSYRQSSRTIPCT